MLPAVPSQQPFIQRITRLLGPGMGVHVHQARHQPAAFDHGLGPGQALQGDPVASDVQVPFLLVGQDNP